ncbi:MAG: hypothetical protein JO125_15580 [Chloroflexi bacterium]|nr:hypothetical protein [Ktedonobacteraceae bacterium]MBV9708817.1 hypothetical protein [Chloroflexota bacterium]
MNWAPTEVDSPCKPRQAPYLTGPSLQQLDAHPEPLSGSLPPPRQERAEEANRH